ncbi:hypothetical protein [Actinokineospora globicatena]|uniref:Uncharacterized protein n=1 Tax=Actinokineospora globicatena TaxID=103729 RepID=A0A9W6QKP6_9PSEU|nr:hypothetical protein [Actinokineospora globicatena]MCP2300569.1 hypothetical protein [Actinokineospora globicatena]GLW81113.1 hypothetical protein Aglo01_55940 [Actinokineospora globicatena]GLW88306.1 hypothetical protein Aglo02_59450 [Actinokineospora globicatena]GLW92776.1 hypothetical protein Aglo03_35920 [Actinokineospora globicatena]
MNYQAQGYYPQFQQTSPGSPGTSVLAGIGALGIAAGMGGASAYFLAEVPTARDIFALPAGLQSLLIGRMVLAALALIGAILLFTRRRAGVPLVALTAVASVASLPLEPLISELLRGIGITVSGYFEALLEFNDTYTILLAVGAATGLIAFLFAILPATSRWLRTPRY